MLYYYRKLFIIIVVVLLVALFSHYAQRGGASAQSGVGGDIGNIYIYILYIPDIPPIPAPTMQAFLQNACGRKLGYRRPAVPAAAATRSAFRLGLILLLLQVTFKYFLLLMMTSRRFRTTVKDFVQLLKISYNRYKIPYYR